MTKTVLVLAASFSLREDEPNPCNWRIANDATRICYDLDKQGHRVVLVAQWEVAVALKKIIGSERLKAFNFVEIGQYEDGQYLGTKEVYEEAKARVAYYDITHVVAVANPFLHQPYLYWLARADFKLLLRRVRWIGFDRQSTQWWCRSWYQLLWYTVKVAVFKNHGYDNRQVQA